VEETPQEPTTQEIVEETSALLRQSHRLMRELDEQLDRSRDALG
jgi:hypothetical protein